MRGCFLAPDPEPDTRQYGAGDDFSVRQGGQRLLGPVNTTRPAPPRARQPPRPAATPAPRPTPAPGHAQPPPPGSAHNPSLPLVGVLDAGLDRLTIPLMIRPCAVRASCSPSSRSWSSSRRRAASFGAQHRDPRLSSAIPLLTSLHSTTALSGGFRYSPTTSVSRGLPMKPGGRPAHLCPECAETPTSPASFHCSCRCHSTALPE